MNCNRKENHLLRCEHSISEDNKDQSKYVKLMITSEKMEANYDGDVMLWSPDPPANSNGYFSPSYGAVVIFDGVNMEFITFSKKQLFSVNVADTICRQLGYTESIPNSAMLLSNAVELFNFNFSNFNSHM